MRVLMRTAVLATAAVVAGSSVAAAQAPLKVGYVNSRVLLAEAPGAAQAQELFQREMSGYQEQVKRGGDSLQTAITSFQQRAQAMPAAQRDSAARTLEARQLAYQQRVQGLEQQAQEREMALAQPIMQNIQRVLTEVRQAEGYHFIFDVAASGAAIVAADTTLDLTQRVLTRLKAMPAPTLPAAGTAATPPAPSGPVAQPAGVRRPPASPRR